MTRPELVAIARRRVLDAYHTRTVDEVADLLRASPAVVRRLVSGDPPRRGNGRVTDAALRAIVEGRGNGME